MLPSHDEARALLVRLRLGDPTASSDLVVAYLDYLARWLRDQNPGVSTEDCLTAAEDALLALIKKPSSYDSKRGSLLGYLRMSAAGDLKNRLRAERRHALRRAALESVELSPEEGKYLRDEQADPAWRLEIQQRSMASAKVVGTLRANLSPEERRVLELMLGGERKTQAYAEVLGLLGLPAAEQKREVKRVKDRLKKRLERTLGKERP
jgi:RNA polymerase sigma-70 factor (ECF subfamily)